MSKQNSAEKKTHSMSHFQSCWLQDDKYKSWISEAASVLKARCKWCQKDFDVTLMGSAALDSHAKSAKHKEFEKLRVGAAIAFAGIHTNLDL